MHKRTLDTILSRLPGDARIEVLVEGKPVEIMDVVVHPDRAEIRLRPVPLDPPAR